MENATVLTFLLKRTPKIGLECLLCYNQSQARFSTTETTEDDVFHRSQNYKFSFWFSLCPEVQPSSLYIT